MNICIALSRFFPRYYGGMINDAHDTAQALRARGHDVWLLCSEDARHPEGKVVSEDTYNELPIVRIWLEEMQLDPEMKLVCFEERIGQVVAGLLAARHTDVLHIWNFATLTTAVVPAAHSLGIPVVYKATDYGATCWRYTLVRWDGSLCDGRENLMHCLDCRRPWSSRSDLLFNALSKLDDRTREWFLALMEWLPGPRPWLVKQALLLRRRLRLHRPALLDVDLVIAPSSWMRDVLVLNGFSPDRVVTAYYGVRPVAATALVKSPSPVVRFGYMGRIHPSKGVDQVVAAFLRLPDPRGATLSIFGVPVAEDEMNFAGRVWAMTKGVDTIRLEPLFPPERLSQIMQNLDVLVVPSMWYENSSIVVLEALAHRTPVIMSDVAGNRDHIQHEYNGLLFPMGDVDALAAQMQRCIAEPGLLQRLTQNTGLVASIDEQIVQLEQHYIRLHRQYRANATGTASAAL